MKVGIPREVKNHEYRVAITPAGVHELVRHGHEVYRREGGGGRLVDRRRRLRRGGGDDPGRRRRRLGHGRPDPQGQGADRRGVPADAGGPDALHVPPPGRGQAAHRGARPAQGHRHRLRDRRAARPLPAAARADERGRRPARAPGRGAHPDARPGRARHPHGRRPRRVRRPRSSSSAPASPARTRRRSRSACRPRSCCSTATSPGCASWTRSTRATARPSRRTPTRSSRPSSTPTWSSAPSSCPGAKAPKLVTNELVSRMKPGSVLVDISIDQGGCFEDSRPTTHDEPDLQGPQLDLLLRREHAGRRPAHQHVRADQRDAALRGGAGEPRLARGAPADPSLAKGLNTYDGAVTYGPVAEAHGMAHTPVAEVLS